MERQDEIEHLEHIVNEMKTRTSKYDIMICINGREYILDNTFQIHIIDVPDYTQTRVFK